MKKVIVDEKSLSKTLDRLALEIVERHSETDKLCLVGIKTRGVFIAQRLQERIKNFYKIDLPLGVLDITLYRDDLTQVAQDPQMKGAAIGFDIKGKDIVLIDDVLYTGRTVRCALDALMTRAVQEEWNFWLLLIEATGTYLCAPIMWGGK